MMTLPNDQKQVLVLGAGVTGVATAHFLTAKGDFVTVADDRDQPPGEQQLRELLPLDQLRFGQPFESLLLTGFDQLVVSPGLPRSLPVLQRAKAAGVELTSDIEIFLAASNVPVIAVTGTNGKSTLVTMIAHLLGAAGKKVSAGGNLGPAALDLLLQPDADFYVLELSSFQLEWLKTLNAAVAVITNITPDHLDRYDSFESYRAAKARVLLGAGKAVLNLDDSHCRQLAMTLPLATEVQWYGSGEMAQAKAQVQLSQVPALPGLVGHHNRVNGQAALTVVAALGLSDNLTEQPWKGFNGLPHRLQWIAEIDGVKWLNDSKATNVGATLAAVEGVELPPTRLLVVILGGVGKGQDFSPLQAIASRLRAVVTIGVDGDLIGQLFQGLAPVLAAGEMDRAVSLAGEAAWPGDSVLLSPACASQDQYLDYQQRGNHYSELVRQRQAELDERAELQSDSDELVQPNSAEAAKAAPVDQ